MSMFEEPFSTEELLVSMYEKAGKRALTRMLSSFLEVTRKLPNIEDVKTKYLGKIISRDRTIKEYKNLIDSRIAGELPNSAVKAYKEIILKIILNKQAYSITEEQLFSEIKVQMDKIVEKSKKLIMDDNLKLLNTMLEIAWNDETLTPDEYNLIDKVRDKLRITLEQKWMLDAQLGYFPPKDKYGKECSKKTVIDQIILALEDKALLFEFKDNDDLYYIIPDEIAKVLREELGIELRYNGYKNLLNNKYLHKSITSIIKEFGLETSRTVDAKIEIIIDSNIKPSVLLNRLWENGEENIIKEIAKDLKINYSQQSKIIKSIIDWYDKTKEYTVKSDKNEEKGENYIRNFIELAQEKREDLLRQGIIGEDMESTTAAKKFEEATTYIFEKIFGCKVEKYQGNKHPDGKAIDSQRNMVLWDNKSTKGKINLKDHFEQFARYVRDEGDTILVFLVIAPEFTPESEKEARRFKNIAKDTDICLIRAESLLELVNYWRKSGAGHKFSLKIFNYNGLISTEDLIENAKEFIK